MSRRTRILRTIVPVVLVLAIAVAAVGVSVRLAPPAHAQIRPNGGQQQCLDVEPAQPNPPTVTQGNWINFGETITNDCPFLVGSVVFRITNGVQNCSDPPGTPHYAWQNPSWANGTSGYYTLQPNGQAGDHIQFTDQQINYDCYVCQSPLYWTQPHFTGVTQWSAVGQGGGFQAISNFQNYSRSLNNGNSIIGDC